MIFGTMFLGGVKHFKDQKIQTKFLMVGIPIAPIEGDSMLVTKVVPGGRQGIPLKLHMQSVLAGYTRVLTLVGAFILIMLGLNNHVPVMTAVGVLLAGLAVYLYFFLGRSTAQENEMREMVGELTGFYVLPEWLESAMAYHLFNSVRAVYEEGGRLWQNDVLNGVRVDVKCTYVIALLYAVYDPCEESERLREKAEVLYKGGGKLAVVR
ncbi:hypothetical protein [Chitinophaga pinensis]|uniref:Uncharacterized protein n=1 Tax=Chitinophaga pinensis (strain ATCC 43595 / DSM 2588 / LMG 13176 / NBRC 15968 / NCIMB 11800 / UQM 2034) TaxID=485918 RepID=A0A979G9L3_CHIPD|nr:hypothetical protein [Chitinophaga pinensis]ACU63311.1 hypothetical protein Cpin_5893 [Chitinophaga pinensis DSM 2588]